MATFGGDNSRDDEDYNRVILDWVTARLDDPDDGVRTLAAKTVQFMGLNPVAHIVGGFEAWKQAGGPIESLKR